jgi:hypothetical protein
VPGKERTRLQEKQEPATPTARELTEEERETRRQELIKRNQALLEMLNEWSQGDEQDQEEQRETWELLKRLLDEDRPSHRKLFPVKEERGGTT